MSSLELRARKRAVLGKKVAALRRDGLVPANLYGPGVPPTPLEMPAKELDHALRRISGSTLVPLVIDGEPTRRVLIREIQRHPVTDTTLHVDLFAVSMSERMRTAVSIHLIGEAPAVVALGGTLIHNLDAIEVESLPGDLPARFDVDISGIAELHDAVHVRDLTIPAGVTVLTPEDTAIVLVVPPRIVAEEAAPAAEAAAAPEAPAAEE